MKHTQTQHCTPFSCRQAQRGLTFCLVLLQNTWLNSSTAKDFFSDIRTVQLPKVHRNYKIQSNSMKKDIVHFVFVNIYGVRASA
jgi:hypothetical protein